MKDIILFLDLQKINQSFDDEIQAAVKRVVDSGWYLLGEETAAFEKEFAAYNGIKHCIGVANGLDALRIIFRGYMETGVLNEQDEIIVPANTYIASILSITDNRLKPVFVEPDLLTYNLDSGLIESHITPRTRAILLVHLYGRNAYTEEIGELCRRYNLLLVEDCAQAHGAFSSGRRVGTLGNTSGFSFYPGKNLGALGDAGAICTDNEQMALVFRTLANYGSAKKYENQYQGYNSRLDELQAAVLRVKLKRLDHDNQMRREAANLYIKEISNPEVMLPAQGATVKTDLSRVWHLFVIRHPRRDDLQKYLSDHGVQTLIHYPIPPHKQQAYRAMNKMSFPITEKIHREVLSLPLSQVMTKNNVMTIVGLINKCK